MSEINLKPATCQQVRDELLKMQEFFGSAIKPLALYHTFYECLQSVAPSKMNRSKVRDIVDTYCALCNEYYLLYSKKENLKTDFFMNEARWAKYYLGRKAMDNSIEFLREYGFIRYRKGRNPYNPINTVRFYEIDLALLVGLRLDAEKLYEKQKSNQKKY